MPIPWIDPLSGFTPEKAISPLPTGDFVSPQATWRETTRFKATTHPVGRLRWYVKWPGHGGRLWHRTRYWPTRRRVLNIEGEYNPKTMRREKTILDRRPIYWMLGFVALIALPLLAPDDQWNTVLTAAAVFGIYGAVNLCWMLIIGTAGIFSLASYAVVGAAAYGTTYIAIQFGLPWWLLPPIGCLIGLAFGLIIAIPAIRLDGFYYALLRGCKRIHSVVRYPQIEAIQHEATNGKEHCGERATWSTRPQAFVERRPHRGASDDRSGAAAIVAGRSDARVVPAHRH